MRRIECGCEFSTNGNLLSTCEAHGLAIQAAASVARASVVKTVTPDAKTRNEFREKLTLAIAPAIAAQSAGLDAETFAESLDRHVNEVMKRHE